MREETATADVALARSAEQQHGAVSFEQLVAIGIDKSGVSRRVAAGRLHRIHRGVYAVGHPGLSFEGRLMAAVLACGAGAVVSHGSAAVLWGLLQPVSGPVDVSVPSVHGRSRRTGIRLHRCPSLAPGLVTERRGIPVTTPARTIGDLRSVAPAWQWRRAVRQAEFAGFRLDIKTDGTRSDPEADFLRLCRRHRLPTPEVNVRVGRWTVDFLWRSQCVVVETDSYRFHCGSIAFEDDHARDLDLHGLGIDIRRFTCDQIDSQPDRVAAAVREALRINPGDHRVGGDGC